MKKITYLFIAVITLAFSFSAKAQCDYTIELSDSWGDGWNGVSNMDVLVNGLVVLDDIEVADVPGDFASFTFTVNPGDDITTVFNPAATAAGPDWASEAGFRILNSLGGVEVDNGYGLAAGPPADVTTGTITVVCPSCDVPVATFATVDDCVATTTFSVDVTITDIGAATSVTITDDQGTGAQQVLAAAVPTTVNYGSYPSATNVVVTVTNDDDGQCLLNSGVLTVVCPATNDDCVDAIAVNCDDVIVASTGAGSGATDSGGGSAAAPDVWYSYTGPGSAEDVTVSLCGSSFDTLIRVYDDCAFSNMQFNDDFCGLQSELTFASDGTTTYYILVEGFGTASGNFTLTVSCDTFVPAPPNDLCVNAEALALDTITPGTTAGATDDSTGASDDTSCDGFSFHSDVWYTFVAPADGDVGIQTAISGTSDQANVAVYIDQSTTAIPHSQLDLDEVGCSDANGGEILNLSGLTPSATYYIRVWSDGQAPPAANPTRTEGSFTITVNDALLSVPSIEDQNGFEYFPNPATDKLTLRAINTIQNVEVYNMLGQEIYRMTPNTVSSEVDMSNLSQGAYFVKVTINDITETIRIIKR